MRIDRIVVALSSLCAIDCAPADGPVGFSTEAILGGADDLPEQFPGVVRIVAGGFWCSGTLISADGSDGWVLTAAHCVMKNRETLPWAIRPTAWTVEVGATVATATSFPASVVSVHPGFAYDRITVSGNRDAVPLAMVNDFALLRVTDLTPEVAATAIPWLQPGDDALAVGSATEVVGYGQVNADGDVATVRQHVATSVAELTASERLSADLIIEDHRGSLAGTCHGDSGGALLVADGAGGWQVGGVISGTDDVGYDPCRGLDVHGRVSSVVADFVEPVMGGAPPAATECLACAFEASGPAGDCHDELWDRPAHWQPFLSCLPSDSFESCASDHPEGAAMYDDYWSCLTDTACPGLCSRANRTIPECSFAFDAGGPCDACLYDGCCGAASACRFDDACSPCVILTTVDPTTCAVDPLYAELRSCLEGGCAEPCAPYLGLSPEEADAGVDGGANDAGMPDAAVPDAGAPDASVDAAGDSGCGCSAPSGRPGGSTVLALMAMVVALTGRRRST